MKQKTLRKLVRVRTRQRDRAAAEHHMAVTEAQRASQAHRDAIRSVQELSGASPRSAAEIDRLGLVAQDRGRDIRAAEERSAQCQGVVHRASMALRRSEVLRDRSRAKQERASLRREQMEHDDLNGQRRGGA
ncbi:MAG: hypothetical protein V3V08_13845 [Nannocystaceae bacterium]